MANSVCYELIALGFISESAAEVVGSGKILRKYASSALRLLNPVPGASSAETLHDRNGHSYSEWCDTYQVDACQRHVQAWTAAIAYSAARMQYRRPFAALTRGVNAALRRAREMVSVSGQIQPPGCTYVALPVHAGIPRPTTDL